MVVINLHYKRRQLRDHLDKRRDIEIRYSVERTNCWARAAASQSAAQFRGRAVFHPQFGFGVGGRL